MSLAAACDDHTTWEEWRACKVCRPRKVKAVKDEKRPPWYANPRVILAWTVPLAFVGIVIGKTVNDEAALEATVAGGLVAILASIATGVFYKNSKNDDEDGS